jgi:iron(III) transport system permease protein
MVCGASWFHTIRKIILPLLKPGLLAGWTLLAISFIREISASILIYSPGNEVISVVVYDVWWEGSAVYATALAVLQTLIVFSIVFAAQKIFSVELTEIV